MKHAVLGAGAIGGLMATAMGASGEEVLLMVRAEKLAGYPGRLTLEQPTGAITAASHPIATLAEAVDVLWIATKAYQLQAALASVRAMPAMVVPLLNGIDHIAVLRARFGDDRVIAATIAVGADRPAEGRFVQHNEVRLNLMAAAEPRLGALVARLHQEHGFGGRYFDSEPKLLWTKLCFLAPFALVTSASGKNKGEIFADAKWKAKLYSAIDEACAVARSCGAEIDASKVKAGLEPLPDGLRSSMAKDLLAGRELELDAISGPILRGEGHDVDVPVTRELVTAIRAKR
ncbi:MAG TPA: 2-dehydropantoate 2-reductase [Terriglobales bacterium]|nr:2-dehydropantoate 2-reductase [Terriglobales bacterium]